jgi:transposase-like protein
MKHLIPYLQDDQKAADYLRQVRWPDGVTCPRCGSDAVEPRERCDNGLQRFNCGHCAVRLGQQFAMFTIGPVRFLRRASCAPQNGCW